MVVSVTVTRLPEKLPGKVKNEKVPFPSSPATIVIGVLMTNKRKIFIVPPPWSPIEYNPGGGDLTCETKVHRTLTTEATRHRRLEACTYGWPVMGSVAQQLG